MQPERLLGVLKARIAADYHKLNVGMILPCPFDKFQSVQHGSIVKHYVIYNSLYVDTLPEFLETMKKNLNNRYGYETDQIFISNYALNYPASKLGQVLTYLTCKTSALLARVNGYTRPAWMSATTVYISYASPF